MGSVHSSTTAHAQPMHCKDRDSTKAYDSMSEEKQEEYLTDYFSTANGHTLIHELVKHFNGVIDVSNPDVAHILREYGIHDNKHKENVDKLAYLQGVYLNLQSYLKKSKMTHANFSDTEMLANALWNGTLGSEQQKDHLEAEIQHLARHSSS